MFSRQEREGLMEARLELTGGCHAVPPKARDGSQRHAIFARGKAMAPPGKT